MDDLEGSQLVILPVYCEAKEEAGVPLVHYL